MGGYQPINNQNEFISNAKEIEDIRNFLYFKNNNLKFVRKFTNKKITGMSKYFMRLIKSFL